MRNHQVSAGLRPADNKWADSCNWLLTVGRECPKCVATKGVLCKPLGYINVCTKEFVKRKEREIAQSRKLRKQLEEEDDKKLVRKRKPIQFTMQDLEADAELEGDDEFMEYFNPADVL